MFLQNIDGLYIGLIEIIIFFTIGFIVKITNQQLKSLNSFTYFWSCMTVLTGIWEISFISNYRQVNNYSQQLIDSKSHVWHNEYDITYILPWKLAYIFYGEYGAYADREYMTTLNNWSRIIEGTHAIFCGIFTFFALLYLKNKSYNSYSLALSVGMGAQLMNSILYMGNYFIQCRDPSSINFNTAQFPTGKYYEQRPFMYVNLFWTFMPLAIIINLISNSQIFAINNKYNKNKQNDKLKYNYIETFKA
jgi:hypothetical protein